VNHLPSKSAAYNACPMGKRMTVELESESVRYATGGSETPKLPPEAELAFPCSLRYEAGRGARWASPQIVPS
jgi:hypothetical protein